LAKGWGNDLLERLREYAKLPPEPERKPVTYGFPTPVEVFIKFLDGQETDKYGDSGSAVRVLLADYLCSIFISVANGLPANANRSSPGIVLQAVLLHVLSAVLLDASSALNLTTINASVGLAVYQWMNMFMMSHVAPLLVQPVDPKDGQQMDSMLYESIALHDIELLITDMISNHIFEPGGFLTRVKKISNRLFALMEEFLENLSEKEKQTPAQNSGAANSNSSAIYGGGNRQDSKLSLFSYADWEMAWREPFRGDALDSLQTKLRLLTDSVTKLSFYHQMSRLIPIVQSSGTGKSRLAEYNTFHHFY
jgi:hypothetical protein